MKGVLLLISTNREMEIPTAQCVNEMRRAGAQLILEMGSSDVSQARNSALAAACDALRERPEFDVVLMLDDDIICKLETARELVAEARSSGLACSAAYATGDARLAGCRWPNPAGGAWPDGRVRWQVGLGCLAIPKALLLELEASSESYEVRGRVLSMFTWSKAENGEWIAEDYRLSRQLGGVKLMPLGVGHWKKGEFFPDDETLEAIRENRMVQQLPGGRVQA
jgi:hypothetical protein